MAELFESYEEEFRGVAADAQKKVRGCCGWVGGVGGGVFWWWKEGCCACVDLGAMFVICCTCNHNPTNVHTYIPTLTLPSTPTPTHPRQLSEALTYESNPEKRRALLRQAEPQVQQLESLVCLLSVLVLVCMCFSEGHICWGWAGKSVESVYVRDDADLRSPFPATNPHNPHPTRKQNR